MKKFNLKWIAFLLSVPLFAQTSEKVSIQASFGRYGSDCSSGRGTCSFSASKNNLAISLGKSCRKISENSFSLLIERNTLAKTEEVSVAGTLFSEMNPGETTFFVQTDNLILDTNTLQNLQIDKRYSQIAAGSYPMSINKEKVEIIFTLKDPNDVKQ